MTSFRKRIIGCILLKMRLRFNLLVLRVFTVRDPIAIAENLQDWNVDEILFLDISPESEINFKLIDEITSKINLPIQYSRAIRNCKCGINLIRSRQGSFKKFV